MMDAIPTGQPLLVDHHSYKTDRNYRDRAWNKMGKAVETDKKQTITVIKPKLPNKTVQFPATTRKRLKS